MNFKKTLFVFLGIFLCSAFSVLAYDDDTTHPALTQEILRFYNLTHPDQTLSENDQTLIIEGSKDEDITPRWVNHFYDPVHNVGWTGEHQGDTPALATQAFTRVGIISRKPLSALEWAVNDLAQYDYSRYGGDHSWRTGLQAYAKDDRENAMRVLGHTLHLLEDMAVPDHTRNDSHAPLKEVTGDEGSPYEAYAVMWNRDTIKKLKIPETLVSEGKPSVSYTTIQDSLHSIAEYSNKYFFSKDTINDQKYENPKIITVDRNYIYGVDERGEEIKLGEIKRRSDSTVSLKTEFIFSEKKDILSSYFSRLASKTVQSGAGVIELFLKQGEDQKITNEFAPRVMGIDRHAFRTPAFSFISEAGRAFFAVAEMFGTVSDAIVSFVGGSEQEETKNEEPFGELVLDTEPDAEMVPIVQDLTKEEPIIEETNDEPIQQQEVAIEQEIEIQRPVRSEFISTTTEIVEQKSTSTTSTVQTIKNTTTRTTSGGGGPNVEQDNFPNAKIDILEIMYDAPGSDEGNEWVEIYNSGTTTVKIKDLRFVDSGQRHLISLSRGSEVLMAYDYGIIADSPEKFLEKYPSYTGSIWKSAMSLSNTHDLLAMAGNIRNLGEAEYYGSSGAGGDGNSLQKIGSTWYAGAPTPGRENSYSPPHNNQKPVVEFSFFPGAPKEREVVTLLASSTDSDGTISKYVWKFGDGGEFTSLVNSTEHTYSTVGTYNAEVDVYDNENEYTRATTTISIEPSNGKEADHVVISEVQYGGVDAGDEFIELYNPTTSTINMTGWSIQYTSGRVTEITPSVVSKKNFVASSSIRGEGYFLIARSMSASGNDGYSASPIPDLSHRSFSMSSASTGGLVFLVKNNEDVESVNDGDIVDFVNYGDFELSNGKSLERRGWNGLMCASALQDGSGEFQGNGCDTEYMHSDFEVRNNPQPQNSGSMIEPRDAPTIPEKQVGKTTYAEFIKNDNAINFSWSTSTDSEGGIVWYDITMTSGASSTLITHTTSTSFLYVPEYVGKEYSFKLKACDRDGACSNSVVISVSVPSYAGEVYFGTRNGETIIELTTERYPFLPGFSDINQEKKLVAYFNTDAEFTSQTEEFANLPNTLTLKFMGCHGYEAYTKDVVFPGDINTCRGFGPGSGNYSIYYTEDNVITLRPTLPSGRTEFLPSDFITFAFYSLDRGASGRYFNLITRDAKRYYFNSLENKGKNPVAHGPIQSEFKPDQSSIELRWMSPTDPDSRDEKISNEYAVSTSTATSTLLWVGSGWSTTTLFVTGIEFPTYAHIRARDTDGNYSDIITDPINLTSPTVLFSQIESDNYEHHIGTSYAHYAENDEAGYQNVILHSTTTFDVVGLKAWKHTMNDSGLRLVIYPSLPSGLPDFATVIGKTQMGNFTSISQWTEVLLTFETPITFDPEIPYWFGLDVPGAARGAEVGWKIATRNTDTPTLGRAGWGIGPGRNETCNGACTYTEADQRSHEWWIKIGKR
ncbi:MAG: PKD domain-containing protein [Parcubacteria group bacterium LiPW_41]|nr:MAG: PKD domain-containing protein [Parcubacteria group bacterium LiPW_41]